MPFKVIRNDITKVSADAIVNTANPYPVYARGTDARIYEAAGAAELLEERKKIGRIERGKAAITLAYRLPAKYIIHTVGPVWEGGNHHEADCLASCLKESLRLAEFYGCESIAFPLISTGVYGFPKDLAIQIFAAVIYDYLLHNDMEVTLVLYDDESYEISGKLFPHVVDYFQEAEPGTACFGSFEEAIQVKEKPFHEYLWELVRESGMQGPEIYRAANITKQHFSKIISNKYYTPGKNTVCALGLALGLDLETLEELLKKAGYSLTDSKPFDLAVKYFAVNGMHNAVENNLYLFEHGIEQLGTVPKEA